MYQNRRFFIRYLIGLLLFGFNGIVASHIALESSQGMQIKQLSPDAKPEASFALAEGDTLQKVYAYCNLHGLWSD